MSYTPASIARPAGEPPVICVTFATPEFDRTAQWARIAAAKFGITDHRIYTSGHPVVRDLAAKHPDIMSLRRGYGYWLWKPAIILDALASAPEGSIILYTDADLRLINDPHPIIEHTTASEVLLVENRPDRLQRCWTKRDCFVLMDADRPDYWNRVQLSGGLQFYRAGKVARQFLAEVHAAMHDKRILTDQPNECGLPNLEGFVEHRHDQSVLTIVAQRHRVATIRGAHRDALFGIDYPGQPIYFEHWRKVSLRKRLKRLVGLR